MPNTAGSAASVVFKTPPTAGDGSMPELALFDAQCGNRIMLYEQRT